MSMARSLVDMELIDQNIKLLGEEGAIPPLVNMASGNLESKDLAFSALAKLLSCRDNKRLLAAAGGVPLVMEHIFSCRAPTIIVAKCSEILERIISDDGIEFLLDANGTRLELGPIITNLMDILQQSKSSPTVRKLVLRSLLSICKSEEMLAEKTVAATNGVSLVLPLLEDPDQEIRELALKLIFHFSLHEPDGIADFLLDSRLEAFVGFLEGDTCSDVQVAAAGLIAYLPKSEVALTNCLIELNVIPILLNMLRIGTAEAQETVLGALFRFTDPSNIKMQRLVVNSGAYPLLVSILKSGSTTAKARAAALIGNLSSNSSRLSAAPVRSGCWIFRASPPTVCEVHGGICNVTSTFCLLKANALPWLVNLLSEHQDDITTYETLQALRTLVQDGLSYRGAKILHQAGAIDPILDVLRWGSVTLKEAALIILEKVFQVREVSDYYCMVARTPLISLSTQSSENGHLGRMAVRVLAEIEHYSKSCSMPLIPKDA